MHIASLRPNFEQQLMALDQISGQNTIPVASAARHFLLFEAALAMVEDSNPTSQNKSTTREKIRLPFSYNAIRFVAYRYRILHTSARIWLLVQPQAKSPRFSSTCSLQCHATSHRD
jgi:hypothetical protein